MPPSRLGRSKSRSPDIFAVRAITLGIAVQIRALILLLAVNSLIVSHYERAIRVFIVGLIIIAVGVVAAILAGIIGHAGMALQE